MSAKLEQVTRFRRTRAISVRRPKVRTRRQTKASRVPGRQLGIAGGCGPTAVFEARRRTTAELSVPLHGKADITRHSLYNACQSEQGGAHSTDRGGTSQGHPRGATGAVCSPSATAGGPRPRFPHQRTPFRHPVSQLCPSLGGSPPLPFSTSAGRGGGPETRSLFSLFLILREGSSSSLTHRCSRASKWEHGNHRKDTSDGNRDADRGQHLLPNPDLKATVPVLFS